MSWNWMDANFCDKQSRLKNVMAAYEKLRGIDDENLFINIHQKTKALYPVYFGGLKFDINKFMTESFLYNCKLNINTSKEIVDYRSYYKFINREPLIYPSESNSPGFLNLIYKDNISKYLKCIAYTYFMVEGGAGVDCILNYYNEKFTGSLSFGNKGTSEVEITGNYLQVINNQAAVGAEVVSMVGSSSSRNKFTIAGRYLHKPSNILYSGSVGTQGSQLCVHKDMSTNLSIGCVFDYVISTKAVQGSVAGQWTDEDYIFRCSFDTNKYIGMNILRNVRMCENVQLIINWGSFTNFKDDMKFGIGLDFLIKK